mmetsp:Transcript_44309/g.77753  ORF Transcript_44309/g.77753 Transcript_44309/m.77753 type:complete len:93 (+) Transcript_44309:935-1213(+)
MLPLELGAPPDCGCPKMLPELWPKSAEEPLPELGAAPNEKMDDPDWPEVGWAGAACGVAAGAPPPKTKTEPPLCAAGALELEAPKMLPPEPL